MTFEFAYLLGPLIGGVIGYITNDIAIRMLFRPHQAKYIFGMHVPFTPGIIPKEKYRIAQAIGETISDNLMNQEVLERTLLSDEMVNRIASTIDKFVDKQKHNTETVEAFVRHYVTRDELQSMRDSAEGDLAKMLYKKLSDESVGTKISHKIIERVMEKMQGGFKGMVGSTLGINQIVELMAEPAEHLMAKHINELISSQSEQMVASLLHNELDKVLAMPVCELMKDKEEQTAQLRQMAVGLYRTVITERLPRILNALNISKIIENRINEMDMNDTERIVHQVMDKELKAVIWFGALLGFIIGILNTVINMG
ncbi:MAG: DUF445 family protein [Prevotella sp.]|nr:DUF445 family protein [Prevotella sp.]